MKLDVAGLVLATIAARVLRRRECARAYYVDSQEDAVN